MWVKNKKQPVEYYYSLNIQLGYWLSDFSAWMTNNKLTGEKTGFIIIGTSRQRRKLTLFFPMKIFTHSITPSEDVRNLCVTLDSDFNFRKHISLTCHSCFYHIPDLRRIRRYIFLSVTKPLLQHSLLIDLITATLNYLPYNIASKDILNLQNGLTMLWLDRLGLSILSHFWNLFSTKVERPIILRKIFDWKWGYQFLSRRHENNIY